MANLNFQQPPRSIANQGLSRSGFSTNSISGHVTPTSGMFPGSTSSFAPQQQQQLSPNRNLPPIVNRNTLFGSGGGGGGGGGGQRSFPDRDRRPIITSSLPEWSANPIIDRSSNPMGHFAMPPHRSYGGSQSGLSNFHSVFGGSSGSGVDGSTPPLLDLSEFPSLTSRGQGDAMPQPAPMPGKQPYVGMVKQPANESSEFTMSNEDFPALPGTQTNTSSNVGGSASSDNTPEKSTQDASGQPSEVHVNNSRINASNSINDKQSSHNRGIQTSPDGKVTNIPASMVKDQFGMVGLLTFIRAAESDPNLVSLALGQDLTALGLNLNSPENLFPSFGGPWAETPCRPQDVDFHVPPEYLINFNIRDKLAQIKLSRYKDDLLFYIFYTNPGDVLQIMAAMELYSREWRYHMEEKLWITQAPGVVATEKTSTYERGTYYFFDPQNWRKVPKEFYLDYSKLEPRPNLPPSYMHTVYS